MYKFILTIFLLIPAFLLGKDYNIDIDSLNKKAKEYIHIDLDSAYYFANRSVVLSKHHQYKQGEMDGTFQLGRVYLDQARRVLALESGIESLKIADEIDSYEGKKNAYNLLSKIYNHSNRLEEGIKTSNLILNLAKEEQDSIQIAKTYNFLGIFKRKMDEPDSSLYYKIESMKINRLLKDHKALAYNYTSLGIYHYDNGNLDTAFSYLRKSLQIRKKLNLIPQRIEANHNIGYLFLMLEVADSATYYFQKSIDLCLNHEKHSNLAILYSNLSESYKLSGEHELALDAIEKSIPIKDSLIGIKQHEQIVKREKKKAKRLAEEIEIDSEFRKKQYLLIFALVIALLISIVLSRISKKKTIKYLIEKQKTEAAKALINEQEQVREDIAQELHDGIGGSLAGLKLNISKIQQQNDCPMLIKELEHLDKTYQEIRNISHNLTPVSFQKQSLELTLKDYITRAFPNKETEAYFHCYPEKEISNLYYDQKICVYRIIQELVTNIQKHAKASNINVSLIGHKDHLTIMVEDNGIGFNNNNNNNTGGIGFKNIKKRTTLYDGRLEIDSTLNKGTTIIIDLPYKNPVS